MSSYRLIFLIIGIFIFFIVIVLRLVFIQITQHRYYLEIANRQQNKSKVILAERGLIKDRNNELLAYSKNEISLFVDFKMLDKKERDQRILSKNLDELFGKKLSYYKSQGIKNYRNTCIENNVSRLNAISLENLGIDAIRIEEKHKRIYPYKNLASHLIGYVNRDNLGIMGVEEKFNNILKGTDGIKRIERDVLGRTVTVKDNLSQNPIPGQNVVLTIDKSIQNILEAELKKGFEEFNAKDAVGIIMDPNSGEIIALANYPDFDPSDYSKSGDFERRNRAITDSYEPGSTIKPIVMSMLLDKNLVNEHEIINTENGTYNYKNAKIRDTHNHPALTVRQIIEQSSNIGMVKLSSRISNDEFYKYLRDFGFGNYTNLGLSGEINGRLKKPSEFGATTKAYMSFGYEMTVTPIQLLTSFSSIINGGILYKPQIVKRIENTQGKLIKEFSPIKIRQVISEKASEKIKEFLVGVVENGTGKSAKVNNIKIGGKTGTSQRLVNGEFSKSEYNTSFIGFFPADNPKYVCLIIYVSPEKAKFGGLVAAPVFKRIVEKIYAIEPVIEKDSDTKIEINKVDKIFSDLTRKNENHLNEYSDIKNKTRTVSNTKIKKNYVMPNLINQSLRTALIKLKELNVECKVIGKGKVVSQSIPEGTKLNDKQVCTLICKSDFKLDKVNIN